MKLKLLQITLALLMAMQYAQGQLAYDVGVYSSVYPANNSVVSQGAFYLQINVANYGTMPSPGTGHVRYSLDGVLNPNNYFNSTIIPVGTYVPVTLDNPILTSGYHVLKAWTTFDTNTANDTLTINFLVGPLSITSGSFMERFSNAIGWRANGSVWATVNNITEANGSTGRAAIAKFYTAAVGTKDTLVSPVMDFRTVTKPGMSFNIAHCTYTAINPERDTLAVIVQVNNGPWSAPIFSKSANGSPSLITTEAYGLGFFPTLKSQWRHEWVDLSAYANAWPIRIGFIAISGYGNNLHLDNVLIISANNTASQPITTIGPAAASQGVQINYINNIIANGVQKVTKFTGRPDSSQFEVNTTATTQSGSIFTPSTISGDFWYTITYDGKPTYNISIDIASLTNAPLPQELYLLKRSVQNDKWVALPTTLSGNKLTASGLTSFSDFAIGSRASANILPVSITNFSGTKTGFANQLSWRTASEINTRGFELQKSTDGSRFSALGFINTKAPNGSSSSPLTYTYTDNSPAVTNFYRLKMIDKDGSFIYSSIVKLSNVYAGRLSIFPNPVSTQATLQYVSTQADNVSITITDVLGKTMLCKQQAITTGTNTISLATAGFAAGLYTVEVRGSKGKDVVRLVKE